MYVGLHCIHGISWYILAQLKLNGKGNTSKFISKWVIDAKARKGSKLGTLVLE